MNFAYSQLYRVKEARSIFYYQGYMKALSDLNDRLSLGSLRNNRLEGVVR